ncbi:MAG: sulfatase, partial [Promethearchaeota archaeon]
KFLKFINQKFKKDCLIIITADHGESFYEHGLFDHQGSVFEELLKIPLFIINLGKKTNKKTVNETVQLLDIAPTILDYFGIKIPEDFQGQSLLPSLEGKPIKNPKYVITECYQKNRWMKRNQNEGFILLSISSENWKYIFDEEKNTEFLFNLKLDPCEKNNLIKENTEKLSEFRLIKNYHINRITESYEEKLNITKSINRLKLNRLK